MTDRERLEELLELESGLSDWDMEFIESLTRWTGEFTIKQQIKLRELHDEQFE